MATSQWLCQFPLPRSSSPFTVWLMPPEPINQSHQVGEGMSIGKGRGLHIGVRVGGGHGGVSTLGHQMLNLNLILCIIHLGLVSLG